MSLNELAIKIFSMSRAKGFWPKWHACNHPEEHLCGQGVCDFPGRNFGEVLALVHSEVSEALEAWRDAGDAGIGEAGTSWHRGPHTTGPEMKIENGEMLFKGVDLHFNTFWFQAERDHLIAWGYIPKPEGVPSELADILIRVLDACGAYGIDIDGVVREKIRYNATREILHGRAR